MYLKILLFSLVLTGAGLEEYLNIPPFVDLSGKRLTRSNKSQSTAQLDKIIDFGKKFLNKPYRFKGPSPWKMDCGGYIAYIFSNFGYVLPHSSYSIAKMVKPIKKEDIRKGDLLFFRGKNANTNSISHVSIVVDVHEEVIRMMHSCSRGIIIEEFSAQEYYQKRFVMAGRLPFSFEQTEGETPDTDKILKSKKEQNSPIKNVKTTDTIEIIGVGDMMLGSNYPSASYLPPKDGKKLLDPVKDIIRKSDIAFGNMEGVLLSENAEVKTCRNPDICYAFKMPDHYVNYFKDAGFNILGIANNHVGDFGAKGTENTVRMLKQADMHFAGLTSCPFTIFEKNGVKYGFCAFAPNEGTMSINDSKKAMRIVHHLDSLCDIVIVSFHGGAEGVASRHVTRSNESYLGENRGNPYKFARDVIDAGADIVFGQGPHVTRAIDMYKGRFIAYSLGNFATYGRFSLSGVSGVAPIIKVSVNKKGEFITGKITSIKQISPGGPLLDAKNKALKEIIELTKADIPEAPLLISQDGEITKR